MKEEVDEELDVMMEYTLETSDDGKTAVWTLTSEKPISKPELLGSMVAFVEEHNDTKDLLLLNPETEETYQ